METRYGTTFNFRKVPYRICALRSATAFAFVNPRNLSSLNRVKLNSSTRFTDDDRHGVNVLAVFECFDLLN